MKSDKVIITGLIIIGALEIAALLKGVNGVLLTTVIGIVALAIGVQIPKEKIYGR